jgi:hypothetical protein
VLSGPVLGGQGTVVLGLEFLGRKVVEGGVQALGVVPADPSDESPFDLVRVSPGAWCSISSALNVRLRASARALSYESATEPTDALASASNSFVLAPLVPGSSGRSNCLLGGAPQTDTRKIHKGNAGNQPKAAGEDRLRPLTGPTLMGGVLQRPLERKSPREGDLGR